MAAGVIASKVNSAQRRRVKNPSWQLPFLSLSLPANGAAS